MSEKINFIKKQGIRASQIDDNTQNKNIQKPSVFQNKKTKTYFEIKWKILNSTREKRTEYSIDGKIDTDKLSTIIKQIIDTEYKDIALSSQDKINIIPEIIYELDGLGPLEPLLHEDNISEIMVNRYDTVYIEENGNIIKTNIEFRDEQHLRNIIEKIASRAGRRIDEGEPMLDASLPDRSRVNAVIPPLSVDGACVTIRKAKNKRPNILDLIQWNSLNSEMAEYLKKAVKERMNILVSGGTGTGKTTMLNIISDYIPNSERVVTIEDVAELALSQEHIIRLETRHKNSEGTGEITQGDLVRNALRMRPDRIVVGEVRGKEAWDMLQAMNTGHDGSLGTIHANSPRDALARLEVLMSMTGVEMNESSMRRYIASALNVIVQVARLADGKRKIIQIAELTGMEGNIFQLQTIYSYQEEKGFSKHPVSSIIEKGRNSLSIS